MWLRKHVCNGLCRQLRLPPVALSQPEWQALQTSLPGKGARGQEDVAVGASTEDTSESGEVPGETEGADAEDREEILPEPVLRSSDVATYTSMLSGNVRKFFACDHDSYLLPDDSVHSVAEMELHMPFLFNPTAEPHEPDMHCLQHLALAHAEARRLRKCRVLALHSQGFGEFDSIGCNVATNDVLTSKFMTTCRQGFCCTICTVQV